MRHPAIRDAEAAMAALPPQLRRLRRGVLQRQAVIVALMAAPVGAALIATVHRSGGNAAAVGSAALVIAIWAVLTRRSMRSYDSTWLMRRLNAARPLFEDSIELVVARMPGTRLEALQRSRILQRVESTPLPDLQRPYPRRTIALAWGCAAALLLASRFAPTLTEHWRSAVASTSPGHGAVAIDARLRIDPPAYTRLSSRSVTALDAQVPAGSRVNFDLRVAPAVAGRLLFQDGSRLELQRDGERWQAGRSFEESTLYRLQVDTQVPAAAYPLHRIDVIPDRPPEIVVHAPTQSLTLLTASQKTWELEFEATDDYGLGQADLSITLAQGSGENIKSSEQTLHVEGTGDVRHRIYRKSLDLAGLGFELGNDLIVSLGVSDNHPVLPNRTQSASFILRWVAQPDAASEGMEGLVQKAMPAYFSSERQLIIDTEALNERRGSLELQRFAAQADDLGVQQKVLRLRYGQFLGEEFESMAEQAPPSSGAASQGHEALKQMPREDASPSSSNGVGDERGITSTFGHVHDKPEAATLLDPDTRRLLKLALDEMWQAELHLREANLDPALIHENKALEYIKKVQQAERIYLARAGVQLPVVDLGRRLSGDRSGVVDRDTTLAAASTTDIPLQGIWQTLKAGGSPDWPVLTRWIEQHRAQVPDALSIVSAIDRAQRDPQCSACRAEVERALWPLLPEPASALLPRARPDAAGAAYLKALSQATTTPP